MHPSPGVLIYARRMKTTNEAYVENMTSADMLLVSMSNVDLDHVYELEREFLSGMDWNLFVHGEEFFHFIRQIETRIALSQGLGRGWFSYSDMEVLMAHPSWNESWGILFHQALKVLGLCLAVYTVCATSIIWASMLIHHPHLQSPSGCSFLPLTLNSHVKKSTLMHGNIEFINTLPSSSTVCHCPSKETNESFDVTETKIEETTVSKLTPV
ncbi:hypothetical protein BSL78_07100 [Apostichopus japonicus]|uniref:Uncharacterized protein n=1 Tax=Stichopus japonicus TaxID=307972 RepID=A0A2G8L6W0_STIJA|nr:hypothetical protein BSL78_07100 [Apostichopus japonicus]